MDVSPKRAPNRLPLYWQKQRLPDPLSREGVTYYGYGRDAIVQSIRLIGYQAGDNILFPEYMCREVTDYVSSSGHEVRYYRIQGDLTADTENVRSQLDDRTRAILGVHYFGLPQPFCELQQICRDHRLFFIEDNAHGFLSSYQGSPLGVSGDIGILSIRKTLFTPDGAALIVNAPELRDRDFIKPSLPKTPKALQGYWMFRLIIEAILRPIINAIEPKLPRTIQLLRKARHATRRILGRYHYSTHTSKGANSQAIAMFKSISALSWFQLCRTDFNYVIRKRRTNYLRLVKWLCDVNDCQIIRSQLAEGVCPQVLPILVEDGRKAITELRARGIEADYWPDLPMEISNNRGKYVVANYLRSHLITLPINQRLNIAQRDYSAVAGEGLYDRLVAAYCPQKRAKTAGLTRQR